ncbi:MAG: tail fiber domain-containing protein [Alphaproteobacteria bacterium]|nr:tail fiber domain-containing protein [Alphaproteobacteria bacterium]
MRNSVSFCAALALAALAVPLHVKSASAASPYQCKAATEKAAILCCETAMRTGPKPWVPGANNTCKSMVSCGGPLGVRTRCQILPPTTNLNSHQDTPPRQDVSDIRLKYGLTLVGTTAYGLPLYTFHYTFKPGLFEGVMAQDVLKVKPEAVSVGADGYYRVNYELLGIHMRQLQ